MNAEVCSQLGGSVTSLVCPDQAVDVLGREAHLDLS